MESEPQAPVKEFIETIKAVEHFPRLSEDYFCG
jgi:hypothetical protein